MKIYDSLTGFLTEKQMQEKMSKYSTKRIEIVSLQRQTGAVDCGLYAIAAIVDLLFGLDPALSKYRQPLMRSHCARCLSNGHFTAFTRFDDTPATDTVGKSQSINCVIIRFISDQFTE